MLFTMPNGDVINLTGKGFDYETKQRENQPPTKVEVRKATQEDYAYLLSDKDAGDWTYLIGVNEDTKGAVKKSAPSQG